ncbi:hypothetical protein C8Q74DRAFT_1435086 [Fomes fomentarius]|nr:hypothetical protein C8Q74DRAFT_1435086 [Fomes fomentarius]
MNYNISSLFSPQNGSHCLPVSLLPYKRQCPRSAPARALSLHHPRMKYPMPYTDSDLHSILVNNYFAVAATALVLYESVITLSKEVNMYNKCWRISRTPQKVLHFVFVVVRYSAVLGQIVLVLHLEPWKTGGNTKNCQTMVHIGDVLNIISGLSCAALATRRCYIYAQTGIWRMIVMTVVVSFFMLNQVIWILEASDIHVLPVVTLGLDQCIQTLSPRSAIRSTPSRTHFNYYRGMSQVYYLAAITTIIADCTASLSVTIYLLSHRGNPSSDHQTQFIIKKNIHRLTQVANMLVNMIAIPHDFSIEYQTPNFTLFLRAWNMFYPVSLSAISFTRALLEIPSYWRDFDSDEAVKTLPKEEFLPTPNHSEESTIPAIPQPAAHPSGIPAQITSTSPSEVLPIYYTAGTVEGQTRECVLFGTWDRDNLVPFNDIRWLSSESKRNLSLRYPPRYVSTMHSSYTHRQVFPVCETSRKCIS